MGKKIKILLKKIFGVKVLKGPLVDHYTIYFYFLGNNIEFGS